MSNQVRVVVRFRPQNATEKQHGGKSPIEFNSGTELEVNGAHESSNKTYTYDDVFNPLKSQEDIFHAVGIPTIDNVLKGYNGTILAYGQTGSGKTHSMLGPEGGTVDALNEKSQHYKHRGIIPRLVEALFEKLEQFEKVEVSWKVTASVFELYKEGIHDLLTEQTNVEYRIREDTITGRGVYVENLYAKQCLSAAELLEAVKVGVSKRKVASTKSNETSSRSHSVTVINVEQVNHVQGDVTTAARLNLVDLAGSEKVAKTQAGGERLKEAQMINLSLTLLGNVIYKLTDGKSAYIPYRDSKLTRILQDSFGGNSVTTLMCHCSPADYNKEETVSTLRFASRAKQIRNKPRVNRELSAKELQLAYAQALERIRALEERLDMQNKMDNMVAPSPTKRGLMTPRTSASNRQEENAETKEEEDGTKTPEPEEDLRGMIDALMQQIEELKQEVFEKQELLDATKDQVEFHKKRAADAEEAMYQANSKLKKEQQLYERRIKDLEAQLASKNSTNKRGGGGGSAKKNDLQLVGSSATRRGSSTARNSSTPDVGEKNMGGTKQPVRGLRRTASSGAARRASVEKPDAMSVSPLHAMPQEMEVMAPMETIEMTAGTTTGKQDDGSDNGPSSRGNSPTDDQQQAPNNNKNEPSENEIELLLRLGKIEEEMRKIQKENETRKHKEAELNSQLQRLNVEVENAHAARDKSDKELDNVRKLLEQKEKQNAQMKRILDELQIDVDTFEFELGDAKQKNTELRHETDRLHNLNEELQETQAQQEYCDMAAMEIMIKSEDMDAIEHEAAYISMSEINGDVFSATKTNLLETISTIESVMVSISNKLTQAKQFNSSNLEGARLNILNDCAELTSRCGAARSAVIG